MDEIYYSLDVLAKNYMDEITKIIQIHSNHSIADALEINKHVQKRLIIIREKMLTLLDVIRSRYRANTEHISDVMVNKKRGLTLTGAYVQGRSFFYEGNLYFRDKVLRNCPNNEDYLTRRLKDNEIFPKQWDLRARHVWTIRDKTKVVYAVKEQVIEHLNATGQFPTAKSTREAKNMLKVNSQKLAYLLEKVNENFSIDWIQISAYNLEHRHSPEACEAIWNMYLNPKLKRTEWTEDEKQLLLSIANKYNFQNWSAVSSEMGSNRSEYQCFIQFHTVLCYKQPNRLKKWSDAESKRLLDVVKANTFNNVINWPIVFAHFPDRNKSGVLHRYNYTLSGQYNRGHFTAYEDLLLMAAAEEYKGDFRSFPRSLFPNRSRIQLRNHYQQCLLQRHKIEPWSREDDERLLKFVSTEGETAWVQCAKELTNHTASGCRVRYQVIKRHFEKDPSLKIENLPRRKRNTGYKSEITVDNWLNKIAILKDDPEAISNFKNPTRKSVMKEASEQRKNHQKEKKSTVKISKISTKKTFAITKSDEKPIKIGPTNRKRKQPYYEKLRPHELRIYNFFKCSYNFRLNGAEFSNWATSKKRVAQVMKYLNFKLPTTNQKLYFDERMSTDRRYKTRVLFESSFVEAQNLSVGDYLPPGYSTAMAFRALCISTANKNEQRIVPTTNRGCEALGVFRQRLMTLLFRTTLLNRLDPFKQTFYQTANKTKSIECEPQAENVSMKTEHLAKSSSLSTLLETNAIIKKSKTKVEVTVGYTKEVEEESKPAT